MPFAVETKWDIPKGDSYYTSSAVDGHPLIVEHVWFIVAKSDLHVHPPFLAGVPDSKWVTYREGRRPSTKEGWENLIGYKLMTML